jgi:hypothetical protein
MVPAPERRMITHSFSASPYSVSIRSRLDRSHDTDRLTLSFSGAILLVVIVSDLLALFCVVSF